MQTHTIIQCIVSPKDISQHNEESSKGLLQHLIIVFADACAQHACTHDL